MEKKYCERGHVMVGDTCSHCGQKTKHATKEKVKSSAALAPNRTLVELRELKSRLQKGGITEAEYDEQRNNILANF